MQASTALFLVTLCLVGDSPDPDGPRLIDCRVIWDAAPHNAFTDLIRFGDRWYCVFREGKAHVSPDGKLRIITSADGREWTSAALLADPRGDLRDAKITVTPDGRLMLSGAVALPETAEHRHQSVVWFSPDGREWQGPHDVADPDVWLWRITWHGPAAYGFGYATTEPKFIRLYRSAEGVTFQTHIPQALSADYPNETSIVFTPEGTALCLLRRDGGNATALLGRSAPPYSDWTWRDLKVRIGGPHMIRLPDGRWVAAVRLYSPAPHTALCWLDPEGATMRRFMSLPSGGDTSYAGLAWHEGRLWVSYYASHEGKSKIYLAQVALDDDD